MLTKKLITAAAGAAQGSGGYVEDVFNTYLYEGDGTSSRTITNGIDLAGEGGMVMIRVRSDGGRNCTVSDTERGVNKEIYTNDNGLEGTDTNRLTAFNSDGFDIGSNDDVNLSANDLASWTFRKAPGFFDIVTYTGDGNTSQTISHNLGSAPGMIWVKRLSGSGGSANWAVYHRSAGATEYGVLDTKNSFATDTTLWNDTEPTDSVFTVGSNTRVNASSSTYVAYLFAHDIAQFGSDENESIIKCGSYTGNGLTTGPTIDLGWEPQWVLVKRRTGAGSWCVFDAARRIAQDGADAQLDLDSASSEAGTNERMELNANGFQPMETNSDVNMSGASYIYMAIRRADKAPEDGTDFFQARTRTGTGSEIVSAIDFNADSAIIKKTSAAGDWIMSTRGFPDWASLEPSTSDSLNITTGRVLVRGDEDSTITIGTNTTVNKNAGGFVDYTFKRARGAFDTVFYTGTNATQAIDHGLGAVPKMMWVKCLDSGVTSFIAYHEDVGNDSGLLFNNFAANVAPGYWNDTSPTSTQFTVGNASSTNGINNGQYVAYLFGNVSGVIDIGSYTGTGAAGLQIDCGFTAGARFVLIKCTTTGTTDWNVYDTARGITIGSSPELSLNTSGSESSGTNLEPYSAGFEVNSTASDLNASGETYIYMAIA